MLINSISQKKKNILRLWGR